MWRPVRGPSPRSAYGRRAGSRGVRVLIPAFARVFPGGNTRLFGRHVVRLRLSGRTPTRYNCESRGAMQITTVGPPGRAALCHRRCQVDWQVVGLVVGRPAPPRRRKLGHLPASMYSAVGLVGFLAGGRDMRCQAATRRMVHRCRRVRLGGAGSIVVTGCRSGWRRAFVARFVATRRKATQRNAGLLRATLRRTGTAVSRCCG